MLISEGRAAILVKVQKLHIHWTCGTFPHLLMYPLR